MEIREERVYDINVVSDAILRYKLATLPKVDTILDIGAGDCRFIKLYPHLQTKITFLDKDDSDGNYFSMARELMANNERVNFIVASADDLSMIADKSYDMIMFSNVYEHLTEEEQIKSLKEMTRVLKDDGILVFTCPNRTGRKMVNKYLAHPGHIEEPTLSEIIEKMNKVGLKIVNVDIGMIYINRIEDRAEIVPSMHNQPDNSYIHWLICEKEVKNEN